MSNFAMLSLVAITTVSGLGSARIVQNHSNVKDITLAFVIAVVPSLLLLSLITLTFWVLEKWTLELTAIYAVSLLVAAAVGAFSGTFYIASRRRRVAGDRSEGE